MSESILFVDHSFHTKTQSSAFFVDALKKSFAVEMLYLDPLKGLDEASLKKAERYDYVLLWQMDFLAPVFLMLGKPVITIPMYDGSGYQPAAHWLAQINALQVNFSLRLHAIVSALGTRSFLVRYYKEPVEPDAIANFDDGIKAFLWQRRPEQGINLSAVEALLGEQLSSVHIHDAPDDPLVSEGRGIPQSLENYDLTTSTWFSTGEDYFVELEKCNTFICPRHAEGIGMAMLEAMARGMLILAADEATHNEYIANWVNGILFNPSHPTPAQVGDRAAVIGMQAWLSSKIGYERWLSEADEIPNFIRSCPRTVRLDLSLEEIFQFSEDLVEAYYGGVDYEKFLLRHADLLGKLAGMDEAQFVKRATKNQSRA